MKTNEIDMDMLHRLEVIVAAYKNGLSIPFSVNIDMLYNEALAALEENMPHHRYDVAYFNQAKENLQVLMPSGYYYEAWGEFYTANDLREGDESGYVNLHTTIVDNDGTPYDIYMERN